MNVQDALLSMLQIWLVANARPDDDAAKETLAFFQMILREDHGVEVAEIVAANDCYKVCIMRGLVQEEQQFDKEAAEQLLRDLQSEPRCAK